MKKLLAIVTGLWAALLRSRLARWWQGKLLNIELADTVSPVRTEAEEAVARIVFETNVAQDCVSATVYDGSPMIIVKHNDAQEGFMHTSYSKAADKAIEWLTQREGRFIKQGKASGMNRQQRRAFEKKRQKKRRLN